MLQGNKIQEGFAFQQQARTKIQYLKIKQIKAEKFVFNILGKKSRNGPYDAVF
jgi:hypothetical protein